VTAKDSQRVVRGTQIGFLILLLTCSAQLAYWMADEWRYTQTVREHRRAAYDEEARSAAALLKAGVPWSQIAAAKPAIEIAADGTPRVSASALAQLDADRFHRLNRYAWEGTFFLVVLVGAMGVVYTALREEHALRRQQEEFLAAASHELKSPLASLRLSAETLAMRDPAAPRRAELVQRLLSDLGRLDQMIANVLDASRLSRVHVRSSREHVDLAPIVASVADELRPLADDSGVTIRTDLGSGLTIDADREAVRTIARNLIHNSIKATRENAGTVTVRGSHDAHGVTVQVEDTGIGFAPSEARGLFQKFHRLEGNGHAGIPGTGLGLYLVRRCAELDGATVSASSEGPGKGARFAVRWPASAEEDRAS
jgi:two-component system phosphate regulon sensor histidine kinase PhoR